jgi:Ribonuclease G/E
MTLCSARRIYPPAPHNMLPYTAAEACTADRSCVTLRAAADGAVRWQVAQGIAYREETARVVTEERERVQAEDNNSLERGI